MNMDRDRETDINFDFLRGVIMGAAGCILVLLSALTIAQYAGKINVAAGLKWDENGMSKEAVEIKDKAEILSSYINRFYLNDIDYGKMGDIIYKAMVSGLDDKYAAYYTKDEYKDISEKTKGEFCGIGAYISQGKNDNSLKVAGVVKGGPAEKAGIKKGDIIVEVDGENIQGKDSSYAVSKMKGKKGTNVSISVVRKGNKKPITFNIKREVIHDNTVSYKMLDNNIGYISVSAFETVTKKQFKSAVDCLEKKNEKGLIIDLRDNGGGLLDTALDMLDHILPKKLVVYTKDKNGVAEEYYTKDDKEIKIPIVILVNGNSASASEVFCGALRDYGKAKLLGTKTFGKGIVQSSFAFRDGTGLKFTTSKYYTPKGINIHGTGFEPDIKVKSNGKMTALKESGYKVDNQINAALDYLTIALKSKR
ncbi:MAG: S41 family peptidase [Butyribacter sp.]|jgi:peptidase, S41 family|uniref:S41 family peptidase n=1 Tax=Butyribacter TaxID=2822463 RepID=UPI00033A6099|nr:S41 family peptidase [Clostridium sp.]MCQ5167160.1 S41 family peptidase [Roseburia hominis]CCZ42992.1 putative phage prohead protease HK97 family [Clostridium sp. CAG:122]